MSKPLKTERVPVMFDKELVERIDDYSFANRIRSRGEAIRQLISASLENSADKKGEASA